jgi:hypothetical protein
MRWTTAFCGVLLAVPMVAAGCAEAGAAVGCTDDGCRMELRQGSSVRIGGQEVKVLRVGGAALTIVAGGVRLVLDEKTDIDIGSVHLHLERLQSGVATVDVSS